MIKLEKKTNKILLKEILLRILFWIHKSKIFRLLFLQKVPKIFLEESFREKEFKRLVVFSTFTTNNKVSKNLEFYIKNLYELGSDIVLVDTSENSPLSDLDQIKHYLKSYIWRENFGYDFGSWKVGLFATNEWKTYDQIIFTNDSVYGPLSSLKPIFERFNSKEIDVWGLTDSYEFDYHLMSYFLVFQNKSLTSDSFEKFWKDLVFYPTRWKKMLILQYEVGGTKFWKKQGFHIESFIPYKKLNPKIDKRFYMNPTHVFWDTIITDYGFPFLKRDLLKYIVADHQTDLVKDLLKENNYYNLEWIDLF